MTKAQPKNVHLRKFIPNFVTIFALCAGLTAVREGFAGHYNHALGLLLFAAVLDGIDGKLARMLDVSSKFGAELDTLADFFNFGVAPTILLYLMFFAGTEYANIGWLAGIIFTIACMMRLARFNVALLQEDETPVDKEFQVGVPAPAMAFVGFLPAFLYQMGWEGVSDFPILISIYLICAGGLAVSRIPTFSLKNVTISQKYQFYLFIAVVLFMGALTVFPWRILALGVLLYLASLPLSYSAAKRHHQKN